ncbi:MAG TPA: hypothetical protein DEF43_07470 [Chloroflexus aurantiacus]|jgi:hypothetical protein|uniref:Uncharacterized protein n=1 Tax=Chloroflexus aurantiacus (strain ATCC 29366 / DSM 635 / J-10-fl) TaxID=324602 RepID=A9WAR6_CHLAA|nr:MULTISPECIES: hypothetical protein [Chloroflexus]ABY33294.1 conserved hypothetical protein [Chloroflexus aurantiacus J-10-fl]RMG51242.1 MAG: hypothetical protein D6716_06345 [Chloroflexota bacterium]HBW66995.1 hypothetical protein [Chloroflexus aurantiacus]
MRTFISGIPTPKPALFFSRAARDQAVIFDPACAPLLRPVVDRESLQPWYTPTGERWLLTLPHGYSQRLGINSFADLVRHHPGLQRHLREYADDPEPYWWELPAAATAVLTAPTPRICIGDGDQVCLSWDAGQAVVLAPVRMVAPADHLTLALLASTKGKQMIRQAHDTFTLPPVPTAIGGRLAELAAQAVTMAHERHTLSREFARRLLADFGPPGSTLSPLLERWWELEFRDLLAEVARALRNPIPEPFQPFWLARHTEGRARYYTLTAEIAALEAAIDEIVHPLWPEELP